MCKNNYMRVSLSVILLLSALSCWAENPFRLVRSNPSQLRTAQLAYIEKTTRLLTSLPASAPILPFSSAMAQSPAALANILEREAAYRRMMNRVLEQTERLTQQVELANNTPIGAPNESSRPGKIIFRGDEVGELKPQEYILMAAGYNRSGGMVSSFQKLPPADKPVTIQSLEDILPAENIYRIMLYVCQNATAQGGIKKSRIIDYNVGTKTATITTK